MEERNNRKDTKVLEDKSEPDYICSAPVTDYKTNLACFDLFLAQLIIPMLDGSQTLCLLQESMKSCSKQNHWYH